jgi:hypothetical protein
MCWSQWLFVGLQSCFDSSVSVNNWVTTRLLHKLTDGPMRIVEIGIPTKMHKNLELSCEKIFSSHNHREKISIGFWYFWADNRADLMVRMDIWSPRMIDFDAQSIRVCCCISDMRVRLQFLIWLRLIKTLENRAKISLNHLLHGWSSIVLLSRHHSWLWPDSSTKKTELR